MKKESEQKRRRTARANRDKSVETQEEEVNSKRLQNYRANHDESIKNLKIMC